MTSLSIAHHGDSSTPGSRCPLLDLPDDVVRAIIATVAETEPPECLITDENMKYEEYSPVGRTAALGFLRLSEVCRRFRALLLSMLELWAAVFCLVPEELAETALARSRSAPLTAYICDMREWFANAHIHPAIASYAGLRRLLDLVVPHTERLRSLTVHEVRPEQHAQLFARTLPLLEDIDLDHRGMHAENGHVSVLVDAPNLQRAALRIIIDSDDGARFLFKLPSLRLLNMTVGLWQACDLSLLAWIGDFLAGSPLLEHLKILIVTTNRTIDWKHVFGGRVLQLAHMRSLVLEGSGSPGAGLAALYAHILPNRCGRVRIVPMIMGSWDAECGDEASGVIKTCGPLLQHPSYDGLLVRLRPLQPLEPAFDTPNLEIAVYPAVADASRALHFETEDMPDSILLGIPFDVDSNSRNNALIIDAISSAFKHNNTRQIVIDVHEFEEKAAVRGLVKQIRRVVDELARERDGAQPEEALEAVTFPSRDAFLETPAVWNAHQISPQSVEWKRDA